MGNEVVQNEVKVDLVVREDLNSIVKNIRFKNIKNKYGSRAVCIVTLFNDVEIEFKDSDGLYDLFDSYVKCGVTDFIAKKELVEDLQTDDTGSPVSKYICVKYTLNDGSVHRLFASKYNSNKSIENYYNFYKSRNN